MWLKAIYFFSLLFAALALCPAMAHLLELPNKMNLSREDYLTVQQIYRGWALQGWYTDGVHNTPHQQHQKKGGICLSDH